MIDFIKKSCSKFHYYIQLRSPIGQFKFGKKTEELLEELQIECVWEEETYMLYLNFFFPRPTQFLFDLQTAYFDNTANRHQYFF